MARTIQISHSLIASEKLAGEPGLEPGPEPGAPHLIGDQVRPSILPPHLNGVQVVAGSNPAAPTLFQHTLSNNNTSNLYNTYCTATLHHHSNHLPIFSPPDCSFRNVSLVPTIFPRIYGFIQLRLQPSSFFSQSAMMKGRR